MLLAFAGLAVALQDPLENLAGWLYVVSSRPFRVGDRIQSFGATVAIHDKVTHKVFWCFDVDREELVAGFEIISMAFDIRGRRPMSIPDAHRRREEADLQPDLAPRPPDG